MDARASDNLLLIAAREPVPGETKTRLGATIGLERAAELYRAFLTDLSGRFVPSPRFAPGYQLGWAVTPCVDQFRRTLASLCPHPVGPSVRFVLQEGDGWGPRQTNLLRWGREQGYARTVLTASDSPQMSRCAIDAAFDALDDADVVIGRVHDGGYFLIGMRGFHDVLTGEPMSTASAADSIVAQGQAMGLRVREVPATFDVDVESDLGQLIDALSADPSIAPATAAALRTLGLHPGLRAGSTARTGGAGLSAGGDSTGT